MNSIMPKNILLIILLVSLTFANALYNGFIGDDEVMIVNNQFYRSLENLPLLFSDQYIANSDEYFFSYTNQYNSSGAVSYRPVNSIGYFLDHWLWGGSPLGYHAHSVLLHLMNGLLVYWLALIILGNAPTALLAGLIFALHPLKTEPVCAISYRHDLQACLFALLSFIYFIQFRKKKKFLYGIFTCVAFFLALFSKESAIVLPILFLAHDYYFIEKNFVPILKKNIRFYSVTALITTFYLYIYIVVFPNSAVHQNPLLGANYLQHLLSTINIAGYYLLIFFCPFLVKPIPALYTPEAFHITGSFFLSCVAVLGILLSIVATFRRNKIISFFLLFSLVCYGPVANLIPLANPVAHRFLYFPSIGLSCVSAILIEWINFSKIKMDIKKLVKIGVILCCIMTTITLNMSWKNNLTIAKTWIKDFPDFPKGYTILGIEYFQKSDCENASKMLLKSLELGAEHPRTHYMLGMCAFDDSKLATAHFQTALAQQPNYVSPYIGLGKLALSREQYQEAISYFKESNRIEPTVTAYKYLIYSYKKLNRTDEINRTLLEARQNLTETDSIKVLHNLSGNQ